jgi:hypothetical protein
MEKKLHKYPFVELSQGRLCRGSSTGIPIWSSEFCTNQLALQIVYRNSRSYKNQDDCLKVLFYL